MPCAAMPLFPRRFESPQRQPLRRSASSCPLRGISAGANPCSARSASAHALPQRRYNHQRHYTAPLARVLPRPNSGGCNHCTSTNPGMKTGYLSVPKKSPRIVLTVEDRVGGATGVEQTRPQLIASPPQGGVLGPARARPPRSSAYPLWLADSVMPRYVRLPG